MADNLYCAQQINIPPTLPDVLKNFTKAAIHAQPQDILAWSTSYFDAVSNGLPPPSDTPVVATAVSKEATNESVRIQADPAAWILKFDHFENIHKLPKRFEGAPNLRQVPGLPVFGTGQPTVEAFKQIANYVTVDLGIKRIVWTNMRQEPVIFVNNVSFTPREPGRLNENMEFDNVPGAILASLTDQFAEEVRTRAAKHSDRIVTYYKDTYAEHPADRKNIEHNVPLQEVLSLSEVYTQLQSLSYDVSCVRLPIADERAPSPEDFDLLVRSIKDEDRETAVVFNCQMGKGRTTTGMICACAVLEAKYGTTNQGTAIAPKDNISAGDFEVVRTVLDLVPRGNLSKAQLDRLCDITGPPLGLQNLRECIGWTKEKFDLEPPEKKEYWKHMSENFVERYCYLIAFCSYVTEQAKDNFSVSFKNWLTPELIKAIANGKNTFNWQ